MPDSLDMEDNGKQLLALHYGSRLLFFQMRPAGSLPILLIFYVTDTIDVMVERSLAPLIPTKTTSSSKGKKGRCVNRAARAQGVVNITGAQTPITLFPGLTSLLLGNLDFSFATARYGVLYYVIAYVLRRRVNNTPLNVLGVDHCVITSDRAKGLKKYVQELRWDGDEGLSAFEEWDGDSNFTELDEDFSPGTGTAQADRAWFGKPPI